MHGRGSMKKQFQKNKEFIGRTSTRVNAQHKKAIRLKQPKKTQLACKITANMASSFAYKPKGFDSEVKKVDNNMTKYISLIRERLICF
mmetsp:Transcript_41006/g.46582  ORF Transcript_41006/g.46582 Transcript_41006/m.46582 type:complete len:88 (-) Transcript_41006:356-619(-)